MNNTTRAIVAAALIAAPLAAWPVFDPVNDDTDIFLANPAFSAARPNVLIFVDNTANWNLAFNTEKTALSAFFGGLSDGVNVGLAMFVETGGGNDNADGAYIRFGIRQMSGTNRSALATLVSNLDQLGDKGNNATYSLAMDEMHRYYAGIASYSGYGKLKRDYAGNSVNNPQAASLPGNPFTSATSTTYYPGPITDACQKNFIVVISNGPARDNDTSLSVSQGHLAALVGKNPPDTITISPNGEQGLWADEYAKFMANSDCNTFIDGVQNVTTYTIDVLPDSSGQGPSHTALLQSMAINGKGKYFAITDTSNTTQLTNALNNILQEVQAKNNVFASTTLPVSVNVRGTNLNQVYIGVFRPDANKSPRWLGNLKAYRLGVNLATKTLFLADANGDPAENSETGFITGSAVSYWTTPSTYWGFRPASQNGIGGASDSPDGDLVEKGGVAQKVRIAYPSDQSTRKVYTCVNSVTPQPTGPCASGASLSATPFDNTRVTATDLNAFTTYNITSLTSTGTTATITLSAAPNPVWAVGDRVKIDGATPNAYNNLWTLTAANNATFTYQFTLPAPLDSSGALASATAHGLQTGDLITISGTTGFNVTDAPITRLGPDTFQYTLSGVTGQANPPITAVGKKAVSSVSGSGNLATAVVANHGYATGNTVTISGANETAFNKSNVSITVVDPNSFTYSTTPDVISGSSNTAKVTATAHNVSTNQTVRIVGNTVASYNQQVSVTKIDANTFTFPSTETLSGTGGTVGLKITNFSHPTGGGGGGTGCGARDVLTITLESNHNIPDTSFPYTIVIAGGTNEGAGKDFSKYNGSWTLSSRSDAPTSPGNTIIITQTTTTNSSPAGVCNFDSGGQGTSFGTILAGKSVTSINPVVTATGTILSAKSVAVSLISALTNGTGSMILGRPIDASNTLRDQIITWVRGADNKEDEDPATTPAGGDIRPSVHGDVLHSRPAVINYNRAGDDQDIYAFYGANDGLLRAIKGGIAASVSGPDAGVLPGTEKWSFIPREFFGRLKRLRDQLPTISNLSQKDYFADGSVAVFQKDVNNDGKLIAADGDKVYLYITMRRGGEFIYALDVSDPADPKLLWLKGRGDAGWGEVTQTWSEPKVVRVAADIGNPSNPEHWVLVFGAGYDDAVEDITRCLVQSSNSTSVTVKPIGTGTITYNADGTCTINNPTGAATVVNRTKGRGILVVDAFNGNVVWQAGPAPSGAAYNLTVPAMTCSIPSDVTVVDMNRPSNAFERTYVGDTCGNVWRVDMKDTNINRWMVTKIAALSSTADTDVANKRKLLFPPDVVFGTDSTNYSAILLGSGDREHPFDATVRNSFYMIKDRDDTSGLAPKEGAPNSTSLRIDMTGFTPPATMPITDADVFDATNVVVDSANTLSLNGWRIDLATGEKVVSSAVTIGGTTYFNTNQPSSVAGGGNCDSNLGIAREYLVGFADASATTDVNAAGGVTIADRSTIHKGGGYLPSPVPVVVEIDGKRYQAVISGTSVQTPPGLTLEARTRAYWYKEIE